MTRRNRTATSSQSKGFLSQESQAAHDPTIQENCRGAVTLVTDAGFEGVKTTAHNWSSPTGGGPF